MFKTLIKNCLYSLLAPWNFSGAVVLMYHSVGHNGEFFTVTPEMFSKQMEYLKNNNFNVVRLSDLVDDREHNQEIPSKTVIITFDDGYQDNLLYAFPVLKQFQFPATIFVTTSLLGQTTTARRGTSLQVLSAPEVEQLAGNGLIDFGSHSHHHIKLTSLSSEQIKDELISSQRTLEELLRKKILAFAYPFGAHNEAIVMTVNKYFEAICTVTKGRVRGNTKLSEIPRNSIDSQVTLAQFKGLVKFGRI